MQVEVNIVNAFTRNGTGGNPAGVVLDADSLDDAAMLQIAAQVGLSETAFVSRSATEGAKLDFFTPARRIAHCGHATIGAFSLMRQKNRIGSGVTSKETVDGPRLIEIDDEDIFVEQSAPAYEPPFKSVGRGVTLADVLLSVGIGEAALDPAVAPQVVDTGNRFLLIGLSSTDVLAAIAPDQEKITAVSEALDLIGYYLFVTGDETLPFDATTRMFAPRFGILEESATGMAAGPLACLLHDHLHVTRAPYLIEQGAFMGAPSPSLIRVNLELRSGAIVGLMAGGQGTVRETRQVTIADPVTR